MVTNSNMELNDLIKDLVRIRILPIWFFISFFFWGSACFGQKELKILAPSLELRDNIVYITYDILNSHPSENFVVNVEIKDNDGKLINAKALAGDVGRNVSGGSNKRIIWDLGADKIVLNENIYVNVFADKMVDSASEPQAKAEDEINIQNSDRELNKTSLILQSVAFPGLGLTKITGKPHWLKGIAAYGCLGGAIALNRVAISTYQDFLDAETPEDATDLYEKSSRQDMLSETLVYVAAGIWITEIIWTIVGSSDLNRNHSLADTRGISINSGFDAKTNVPLVGITYRF